jgi:squalene-hopene/tetraprenyl-beta-curcumene cyclase
MLRVFMFAVAVSLLLVQVAPAADPAPAYPGPNTADEPLRKEFSLAAATTFLDAAAADWGQNRKCFTCHTNYSYLLVRPALKDDSPVQADVRRQLEELVEERWQKEGPRWDAEVVMSAAVLAVHDANTTGKLHDTTKKALARMWTVQKEDGGFAWIKCDWPPMESDDYFGATMALIGVGAAPENYRDTAEAKAGIERLKNYLAANPPPSLHHKLMLLWAASYLDGVVPAGERKTWLTELSELQHADGGWSLASLGDWKRADDTPQDTKTSDGYASGLAVVILRRSGAAASDERITRAISWLKANQRDSGRWFTRSLHKDSKHYISHAGTAMAALAIATCEK